MLDRSDDGNDAPAEEPVLVRTFLIADIRGYTSFTQERGDEAAAELASTFARLTREGITAFGGQVVELRGDEALATFPSTRQALRAAVDLQIRYARHSKEQPTLPMPAGIGIDAGEAVAVEGGFRGAALNMAARLCSAAGPGEILTTQTVTHLAGTLDGLRYEPRRLKNLKGISEPVQAIQVTSDELEEIAPSWPAPMDRGKLRRGPDRPSRSRRADLGEPGDLGDLRDLGGLGEQIGSAVQARIEQVNERLEQELGDLPRQAMQDYQAQPGPIPPPALPKDAENRALQLRLILALVVVMVLAIAIVLWVHFH